MSQVEKLSAGAAARRHVIANVRHARARAYARSLVREYGVALKRCALRATRVYGTRWATVLRLRVDRVSYAGARAIERADQNATAVHDLISSGGCRRIMIAWLKHAMPGVEISFCRTKRAIDFDATWS